MPEPLNDEELEQFKMRWKINLLSKDDIERLFVTIATLQQAIVRFKAKVAWGDEELTKFKGVINDSSNS